MNYFLQALFCIPMLTFWKTKLSDDIKLLTDFVVEMCPKSKRDAGALIKRIKKYDWIFKKKEVVFFYQFLKNRSIIETIFYYFRIIFVNKC